MKAITKIIGYIGLSVALWRMPHGQAVTLEQINTYIAGCRRESIQNLEALLKREEKRLDPNVRKTNTEYIRKFLEDYCNKKNVYYDGNGDFVIETVNLNSPSFELSPFLTYKKQKLEDWNNKQKVNPLDAISEELSANTLKQRGVDVNELKGKEKGKGINKVYEITFDSILKSPFFTEQQRKQGRMWSQNLRDLKVAVADYAKTCVLLYRKDKKIKIIQRDIQIDMDNRCIQSSDIDRFTDDSIWLPVPENEVVAMKQKIQFCLKKMLRFKNGKEKVILFLLLDNATSPEFRCKWVWDDRKGILGGSFNKVNNAFLFNPDGIEWSLSHEIGHYLQMHLGLKQTFDSYQNSFAQKLLLLGNNLPNNVMFKISIPIQDKISGFDETPFQQTLSAKACFEYCQLIARWESWKEISNILGCYFKSDTLYVNALSDIRELERIRYGHNTKIETEAITKCCTLLKDDNIKQTFTSTCNEAFGKHAPTEALKLLCRLHGRTTEDAKNVVCDFDYDGRVQEWAKLMKLNFIKAEQP